MSQVWVDGERWRCAAVPCASLGGLPISQEPCPLVQRRGGKHACPKLCFSDRRRGPVSIAWDRSSVHVRGSTPSASPEIETTGSLRRAVCRGVDGTLGPGFALTCRERLRSGTQMVQWVGMFEDCANAGIRLWRRGRRGNLPNGQSLVVAQRRTAAGGLRCQRRETEHAGGAAIPPGAQPIPLTASPDMGPSSTPQISHID
jgi:hypothetical protein